MRSDCIDTTEPREVIGAREREVEELSPQEIAEILARAASLLPDEFWEAMKLGD